jgi:hypothetical protein
MEPERGTGTMTFDTAFTHAVAYGKFVVQLWNYYILLIVAILGWPVTSRSKALSLDLRVRVNLIVSFAAISVAFFFMVEENNAILIHLMRLVHALTATDANSRILADSYGPSVDGRLVSTVQLTSRLALPILAVLVGAFMWLITAPVPDAKSSGADKTES